MKIARLNSGQRQLRLSSPHSVGNQDHQPEMLEKLALFLGDVAAAWARATQAQRNRLASTLFEAVWIKDTAVTAVTPAPEFKPFFDLQYDGLSKYVLQWRPRGVGGSRHNENETSSSCRTVCPQRLNRSFLLATAQAWRSGGRSCGPVSRPAGRSLFRFPSQGQLYDEGSAAHPVVLGAHPAFVRGDNAVAGA